MPETAAERRRRKLHDAVVAGRARRESPGEDAAVEKVVTPTQASETTSTPAATAPKPKPQSGTPQGIKLPKVKPTAKVYQRHVVFALVAAFLIKLVSEGKSLPRA